MTGEAQDRVLAALLEVTMYAMANHRPLFSNPLEEPVFYQRYFYRWVKEGIEEVRKANAGLLGSGATPPAPALNL